MPEPFQLIKSRVVPLPVDNIDTDQIIPARYLKVVDRNGLADGLFANWRSNPEFVLNRPKFATAQILLAGENFGCGSSREHAPWALHAHGFRVVISSRFADIFKSNSLKNGLLPVTLPPQTIQELLDCSLLPEGLELEVDLNTQTVCGRDGQFARFEIDPFARRCLLDGVDQLGYLLQQVPAIEAWEESRKTPIDSRLLAPQPLEVTS